jgi:hypothetical protein
MPKNIIHITKYKREESSYSRDKHIRRELIFKRQTHEKEYLLNQIRMLGSTFSYIISM